MENILGLWNKRTSETTEIPTIASYYIETNKEIKDGKSKSVKHFNYEVNGTTIREILKGKIDHLKNAEIAAEEAMSKNFLKRMELEMASEKFPKESLKAFKKIIKKASNIDTDKKKIDFFNFLLSKDSNFYNILVNSMKTLSDDDSIEKPQYKPAVKEGIDEKGLKSKKKESFFFILGEIIKSTSSFTKDIAENITKENQQKVKNFNLILYQDILQRIAFQPGGKKGATYVTLWNLLGQSGTYVEGEKTAPGYTGSFRAQDSNKEWGDFVWEKRRITVGNHEFDAKVLYKIIEKGYGNIFDRNASSQLFLHDILTSTLPNAIEEAYYNTVSKLIETDIKDIISSDNPQESWEKWFQNLPNNTTFKVEFNRIFSNGLKQLFTIYKNKKEIPNSERIEKVIIKYLQMGRTDYNTLLKTLFPIYKQKDASMNGTLSKKGEMMLESVKKSFIKPPNLPIFSSDKNRNSLAGFALEQLTDEVIRQLHSVFKNNPIESVKFGTSIKPKGDIAIYMPEISIKDSSGNSKSFLTSYTEQSRKLVGKENKDNRNKAIESFIKRIETEMQQSEDDIPLSKAERTWLSKSSGRILGWTILDNVLTDIGGDLIFISDKLYRPDSAFFSGFTGEEPNLYGLGTTLKIYDRIGNSQLGAKNIDRLIGNILSSRNGLPIGITNKTTTNFYDLTGTTEVTNADRELIIYSIAGFLFDDFLLQNYRGAGDENAKRPNVVHLFCLNGTYYPFSIFLDKLLKAIDETDNIIASSGFSNASISLSDIEKTSLVLEDKAGSQETNVEKTGNLLTDLLYKKTKVSFHFLRNFIRELQRIFDDKSLSI